MLSALSAPGEDGDSWPLLRVTTAEDYAVTARASMRRGRRAAAALGRLLGIG